MINKYQNSAIKFFSFLLALLGFTSCDRIGVRMEYGTPSADYEVKGRVVSKIANKPIQGIRAVLHTTDEQNEYISIYERDTIYTDSNGEFVLLIKNGWPQDPKECRVKFEDIDEEQNGGLFETKEINVTFIDPKYNDKKGNWYKGKATKDIGDVEL